MYRRTDANGSLTTLVTHSGPAHRPVADEESFSRLLALEEKRSKRSKQAFLLVLFDASDESPSGNGRALLSELLAILGTVSRETDRIGWYKANRSVGAMFTELRDSDLKIVVDSIFNRLRNGLKRCAHVSAASQIQFSIRLFPTVREDILSLRALTLDAHDKHGEVLAPGLPHQGHFMGLDA